MKIGILECWTNRPEWIDAHGDFADWFRPFLQQAEASLSFEVFHAHQGHLPADPTDCDAWLVTGSGASVYEDLPWQADLAAFLLGARGLRPIIGVCYGHQLLHSILAGQVEHAGSWGIGVHSYEVHCEIGDLTQMNLIASHQDQVVVMAPGSTLLASNAFCPFAATRIGNDIITIQPHPEMTSALGREVFAFRRDVQGDDLTDRALASLATPCDDAVVARWMIDFVRDHANLRTQVA